MSAEKIYHSNYPDIEIPETSCWHLIFDNPNRLADDKVVYVNGLTDETIKSDVEYTGGYFQADETLFPLDSAN
jgi:hypothetical protein